MRDQGEGMSGQGAHSDAARIEAWRRWHEQMAQQRMLDRRGGDYGARSDYYDDDYAERRGSGNYYDRGPRYRDGGDYYSDRGDWRGPRGRSFDERYGYRDDPYYSGRDYDDRRYGRSPGYYEDDWSAQRDRLYGQDRGYRGRWSDSRDWRRDDMQGFRDDRQWRGGRWHDERWGEGTADNDDYGRYPGQSRGQGMGDMTGRGWGYSDPYQGETGGAMSGSGGRWQDDGMGGQSGR